MKRRNTPLLLLFFTGLLFANGCQQYKPVEIFCKNYIERYAQGDQFNLSACYSGSGEFDHFSLDFVAENLLSADAGESFSHIAARNGDSDYNRVVVWRPGAGPRKINSAWADNFQSIRVTSDTDWDATHPAGTPLDDLIQVVYYSHAHFVRSGYTDLSHDQKEMIVSELTPADLEMIYDTQINFFFLEELDPETVHTLTIELTTTEGEVLSGSIRIRPRRE